MASVAKDITSKITLNDGVSMPLFGLGVWRASPGPSGQTETAVEFALQKGYRMIDTAEMYELDVTYIDLYLVHSSKSGKIIETYKAMLELKEQGLIRNNKSPAQILIRWSLQHGFITIPKSVHFGRIEENMLVFDWSLNDEDMAILVSVSNFGIKHLEGIKSNRLPVPSVNQIELHPWQQKPDIVNYCRNNNIAVMGYAPLVKGQRFDDEALCEIAKRFVCIIVAILLG
ncbi:unnamed protein product [Mytilus coruscus]|uniref:NADP-dependent oxidoreductase domain-containing protein n=1 Tax=Mytilus coruscus TaxID=42192 RepID=A0A6J8AYM5_MYTCO|nr:unnamed protein product [Mytilus coruscus]